MARDLALERVWRERMRQFENSGLTIRKFCEQEGLVDHQFSWWRGELKRRATKSPPRRRTTQRKSTSRSTKVARQSKAPVAGFVPVQIETSIPTQPLLEIVLDQPPRIRVARGFDADLLREVVRVLERS